MHCTFSSYPGATLESLALQPDEIHIWCAALDISTTAVEKFHKLLAPDEKERAGRFHFARHQRQFIASRGLLRTLLAAYTNVSASSIQFNYGPQDKPSLIDNSRLEFNLSHSGELVLVALVDCQALGVDVEILREIEDAENIAQRFFSRREREMLGQVSTADLSQAFLNCWTRKEAYIKALGGGLSIPLDSFAVSLTPGDTTRFLWIDGDPTAASAWSLYHLDPAPGYVGALAIAKREWKITAYRLDIERIAHL